MPKETLDEPLDMDADSSAAPELDEADAAAPEANADAPADSSAATGETEADNLSVVRDVVAAGKEESGTAASPAEGEEDGTGADETGAPAEQDNENYSDVPFREHPRFKQLIREKNSYREDAGRYRNVEAFLDQANLTAEEAANTMSIAGLAKTDPVKAWEQIQPWLQTLAVAAGVVLTPELEQQVAAGTLTREAAQQISKANAAANAAQARAKFDQERGQRQQQTEQSRTLRTTAENWLTNRRIKDPNFATKEARLHERIVFLQRTEGVPNTVDGVKAQLNKAYTAINKEIGTITRAAPANANAAAVRRPAIRPVTGGQVAANASQAKPTSTLEAIRRVKQRATS